MIFRHLGPSRHPRGGYKSQIGKLKAMGGPLGDPWEISGRPLGDPSRVMRGTRHLGKASEKVGEVLMVMCVCITCLLVSHILDHICIC